MTFVNSSFITTSNKKGTKLGASSCSGNIINCDHCGQKIEILNGRPLNYHEGSLHRCGRQRRELL